jgi:DNA primase
VVYQLEAIKEEARELIDVVTLLEVLGFSITSKSSKEVRAPCLIHGGDNPSAFRITKESKRFSCYSHKCEHTGGKLDNDVFSLVMKVKKISFPEAVIFIASLVGLDVESNRISKSAVRKAVYKRDISKYVEQTASSKKSSSPLPEISEDKVKNFVKNRTDYFYDKGVDLETHDYFEIGGGWVDDYGVMRATVPIRDVNGRLVSISGRRIDNDKDPRYLLSSDFIKGKVLYNLHNAISVRDIFDSCLIIVEGFKACWAVHSAGFPNVVACMGSYLMESQAALAAENGFRSCILMFDGDKAGEEGSRACILIARKYMRTHIIRLFETNQGKSPDDLSDEDLIKVISSCSV